MGTLIVIIYNMCYVSTYQGLVVFIGRPRIPLLIGEYVFFLRRTFFTKYVILTGPTIARSMYIILGLTKSVVVNFWGQ